MSVLFALTASAAAQICTTPTESANQGLGPFIGPPARIWASAAALVALVGVVIGWRALARSRRRIGNGGRRGAVVALGAGLIGGGNRAGILAGAPGGLRTRHRGGRAPHGPGVRRGRAGP